MVNSLFLALFIFAFIAMTAGRSAVANWENQPRSAFTQADYDRLRVRASHLTDREVKALKTQAQAQAGDVASQLLLGMAHKLGSGGLLRDQREAQEWFRRAADDHAAQEGSYIAAIEVAVFYDNLTGSGRNLEESLSWYKNAAEMENDA